MIRTGLDVFCATPSVSGRVGLLTNVASQTRTGQTALTALREAGVEVTALFAPEHGYFGLGSAGETIADSTLSELELPIYSLYNANHAPPSDVIRGLNAVMIDLQDTGTRWYTFAATMRALMKTCGGVGVPVIVLDRPNPLGGITVEGNVADPAYFSLVAPAALPARYGLTMGELARFFNQSLSVDLFVTTMDGWRRDMFYADTELSWVSPSPNMPRPETAVLYSGTCLIEGTNLSEGRGTALPFEQIGAPYIRAEELSDAMNRIELAGVRFTPCWFRPSVSKYAGERCEGVRIHITDAYLVRGYDLGLFLISTIKQLYPESFGWASFDGEHNAFETLTATGFIRAMIDSDQPVPDILELCDSQADDFQAQSAGFWIYDE